MMMMKWHALNNAVSAGHWHMLQVTGTCCRSPAQAASCRNCINCIASIGQLAHVLTDATASACIEWCVSSAQPPMACCVAADVVHRLTPSSAKTSTICGGWLCGIGYVTDPVMTHMQAPRAGPCCQGLALRSWLSWPSRLSHRNRKQRYVHPLHPFDVCTWSVAKICC